MSDDKKSTVEKIVMGAIIGTAIGSAIGMSVAPKKGKETRAELKEKSQDMTKMTKETASGFWRLGKAIFKRAKKKAVELQEENKGMKELPNEMEIIPPEYVDRD